MFESMHQINSLVSRS